MARRRKRIQKKIQIDPKYNNELVAKFINRMMMRGKRSICANILYGAIEKLKESSGKDPVEAFTKAITNVKPSIEVKSRRVGGSTYQVPVEIQGLRQEALAMRWIISFARGRSGKSMSDKLSAELIDAYNETGSSFKKKEDTHKMAEANKAFAHYRW